MKTLTIIFLTFILGKGCNEEKQQDFSTAIIEYTANTRGFYQKIVIQNKMVLISKDREEHEKPLQINLSDKDLKILIEAFQEINLEGIADLKAPSEKRFYDGAAIGNLKITYKGKTYETSGFDHGNPPVEIEKLVTKINTFAKQ